VSDPAGLAAPEDIPVGDERRAQIACVHCGRAIDWCSFCDESGCPEPSCLACLLVALRESSSTLHRHGG
jgi:hypothetical protein